MRPGTWCAEMGRDSAEAMSQSRGHPSCFPREWRPYLLTFYSLPPEKLVSPGGMGRSLVFAMEDLRKRQLLGEVLRDTMCQIGFLGSFLFIQQIIYMLSCALFQALL